MCGYVWLCASAVLCGSVWILWARGNVVVCRFCVVLVGSCCVVCDVLRGSVWLSVVHVVLCECEFCVGSVF